MTENEKMNGKGLEQVAGGRDELEESCTCQFCGKKFRARPIDDVQRHPFASVPGKYWLTHTCRDCELNNAWVHKD